MALPRLMPLMLVPPDVLPVIVIDPRGISPCPKRYVGQGPENGWLVVPRQPALVSVKSDW